MNEPKFIIKNGCKCWEFNDGYRIVESMGNRFYFLNNLYHREDGPAFEFADESKFWYINGKLHRTDGPAIENSYGRKEYWIHGRQYSEEEYYSHVKTKFLFIGDK